MPLPGWRVKSKTCWEVKRIFSCQVGLAPGALIIMVKVPTKGMPACWYMPFLSVLMWYSCLMSVR